MKKLLILTIVLTMFVPGVFAGGGWPQKKGKGYFKLGQNWITSSDFYGPKGDIVSIVTTGLYTTSFYGEYGITDRFTGIVYFPFFVRSTLNEVRYNQSGNAIAGDYVNALGDAELSMKYGIIVDKPIVMSATLTLGLPLGETRGGREQILQTGDGEFNQMIRIDASHSFHPVALFVSVYAGFNNRTESFSDEVRFGGEIGYTYKNFTPILKLNVVQSLYNGSDQVADNGIFSNNTEYVSPTVELNYTVKDKWGISLAGGFALSGKNILASPNWGVGLFLKL